MDWVGLKWTRNSEEDCNSNSRRRDRAAARALWERTALLLDAYLEHCAPEPCTPTLRRRRLQIDGCSLSWNRVVSLVAFVGTFLERLLPEVDLGRGRWPKKNDVDCNCLRLVAVLSPQLAEEHSAWLVAHGAVG
ncbi:bcl-2-like protein 10 [Elephas maximus indicus]|uniref:bcl-2-like protein 10 n=1 Tax=Elephas maximus indicus TaxID=99487 RepID=UPI002116B25D|nr:bcl-2-like protein 10 [Elephas maximus indicus]